MGEESEARRGMPLHYNLDYGRVVKLAATADSKSAEGNLMSVRLRPRPPSSRLPTINAQIRQDGPNPAEADSCLKQAEIYTFSYTFYRTAPLSN